MDNSAEMPFLDHLEELRWRIIWSLGALVVGVVIGVPGVCCCASAIEVVNIKLNTSTTLHPHRLLCFCMFWLSPFS